MIFGMTAAQYQQSVTAAQAAFAERHETRRKSEVTPDTPANQLGPHEWIQLCRDLGWWDNPDEDPALFYERVERWNVTASALAAAQSEASESHPPTAAPSTFQSRPSGQRVPDGLEGDQG